MMDTLRGTVVAVCGPRQVELRVTQIGGDGDYGRREFLLVEALCDAERDLAHVPESEDELADILVDQRVRCFVLGRKPDGRLTVQVQVL